VTKSLVCEGRCNPPGLVKAYDQLSEAVTLDALTIHGADARMKLITLGQHLVHTEHESTGTVAVGSDGLAVSAYRCVVCGAARTY
jgi:hypothetical protein